MKKSIRNQFADTMLEVGQNDQNLIVLVGDISHGILQPFAASCPGRYFNIGICEPTIVSMAAGLSTIGFYPVVHTIAPFLIERSFEQLKLDFCYQGISGNIVTVGGTFDYSNLGCTHHCYGDISLLKTLPNIQILYPGSCLEFDALFKQAYANEHLSVFRIPGMSHDYLYDDKITLGHGIKIKNGSDLTLITTSTHLKNAITASRELQSLGWDIEIIYIHTIRPLDTEILIQSAQKTRRVLVVEEHMISGGLGDEVIRTICNLPHVTTSVLGIPDRFVREYGSYENLCEKVGLSVIGIVKKVTNFFSKNTF